MASVGEGGASTWDLPDTIEKKPSNKTANIKKHSILTFCVIDM